MVVVVVALCAVLFLVIVAFVIDIGAQRLERRQAQTAADAAALAAMHVLAEGGTRADAATEAIRISYENTEGENGSSTLDHWQARWADCTDPERPVATYPVTATSPIATQCISFTGTNSQVRVKLPTIEVAANFAQVIGVTTLHATARAEARIGDGSSGGYAVFGLSTTCAQDFAVELKGGTRILEGPVHSNNNVKSGGGATAPDGVTHRGPYTNESGAGAPNRGTTSALPDPLLTVSMGQYRAGGALRAAAAAAGVPFFDVGNTTITNATVLANGDGIYYTTRDVRLTTASSLAGRRATFLIDNPAATAEVFDTNGTGYDLTYYDSPLANPRKLLVFTNAQHGCATADHATIHFNGSQGRWEGILYAPRGSIHLNGSGSGVELVGAAIAGTVLLDGTGHTLRNPGSFLPRPTGANLIK